MPWAMASGPASLICQLVAHVEGHDHDRSKAQTGLIQVDLRRAPVNVASFVAAGQADHSSDLLAARDELVILASVVPAAIQYLGVRASGDGWEGPKGHGHDAVDAGAAGAAETEWARCKGCWRRWSG